MPLPFALDHINLWVLDDGDGWTLVDTGISDVTTMELWNRILSGPLKGKPVRRLICTHFHPDHMGLAGWLTNKLSIPAYATPQEWAAGARLQAITPDVFNAQIAKMASTAGCDEATLTLIRSRTRAGGRITGPGPSNPLPLDPSASLAAADAEWQVIVGEGHSPRLAALYSTEGGVLISGDQILPKITPNVSVQPDALDADPLALFLNSLERFRIAPDDTLVLPSHRLPFRGLHTRIDQQIAHHRDRLDRARDACRVTLSAAAVMHVLFPRRLDAHQIGFALGETLAHLNYLVNRGELAREPGDILRYRTVAA